MSNMLDLLDLFNWIDRAEWLVMALRYRDLGRTVKVEHAQPDKSGKTPAAQTGAGWEALLKRYGVVIYGRRVTSKHLVFRVKTKQAKWAEYLLLRAGAPVVTTFDARNTAWAGRHTPGSTPPAWRDRPTEVRRWKRR